MNRRGFFSFLPIAPVVVAAAVVEESSKSDTPEDTHNTLQLRAMKKKNPIEYNPTPSGWMSIDQGWTQDESRSVTFGVGRDGNLWIKTEGMDWKRVATV